MPRSDQTIIGGYGQPRKLRGTLKLLLLAAFLSLGAGAASADDTTDLGLTPSHVFAIWTNINRGIVAFARSTVKDRAQLERLDRLAPRKFQGKIPGDVLVAVAAFRSKLDSLRKSADLGPTKRHMETGPTITPSDVFLNSGYVLDGLVEVLIENTGRTHRISRYYRRHEFSGKEPSDVFGLVDLGNRRLDLILGGVSDRPANADPGDRQ